MDASGYGRLDAAIDFIDNTGTTGFAFSRQPGKRPGDRIFPYPASWTLLVLGGESIHHEQSRRPCLKNRPKKKGATSDHQQPRSNSEMSTGVIIIDETLSFFGAAFLGRGSADFFGVDEIKARHSKRRAIQRRRNHHES